MAARPNFVFILADDLGYADLGCYGGRTNCSPVLDRMAAQGLRFTEGYSNSPVCSPTRFALMTARYQYRLRGAAEGLGHRGQRFGDAGVAALVDVVARDAGEVLVTTTERFQHFLVQLFQIEDGVVGAAGGADQFVELPRRHRVESRRRFIEEHDRRIEGEGPGETGADDAAAPAAETKTANTGMCSR